MATVSIFDWQKNKTGEVELAPEVFEQPLRKDVIHQIVRWQLACRRSGTHQTKTRSMVSGGGKKPFKQKGTGNARQGSSRSPLMPGGGITFGPSPRDYTFALTRKYKQLGLRVALSHLLREGRLHVVDSMQSEGKTGELAKRLKSFGLNKAVLMDSDATGAEKFARAAKNLGDFRFYGVEGLNVYDLMKYDSLVVTAQSLDKIMARCGVEK